MLDEPTNHLDLESRESLEAALEAFPGTVLLVSHDRALLDAVAGRLLAVEDGRLVSYPGGWADYVRAQDARGRRAAAAAGAAKREKPKRAPRAKPLADRARRGRGRARRGAGRGARAQLADDWHDAALVAAHRDARDDLAGLISRWEALFEASGSTTR